MAIKVQCQHCHVTIQASEKHAGKTGKCPGCQKPLQIPASGSPTIAKSATKSATKPAAPQGTAKKSSPPAATSQPSAKQTRDEIAKQLLAGLEGSIQRTRPTITYRLGALIVALVMITLPMIYLGLIGLTSYGVYYHVVHNTSILETEVRGRGYIFILLAYLAPAVCGVVLVIFMIKPLFAPASDDMRTRSLRRASEPLLFAFVDRICAIVGAPLPKRIDLDCQVNASASFRKGFLSMFGNDLVLTIGMPLVAGLNTRQFAGVLAHEFGHFAQGAGMRLTYIIRSISFWLLRVVYQRDKADEWLEVSAASLDIRLSWVLYLAMFFVWLSRRVLWCLMMIGNLVGSYLLREMEFDADRYETRLAGSKTFTQTVYQLQLLGLATQGAYNDLREFYREGRLGDDLPQLILSKTKQIPAELQQSIKKSIDETATGLFDTHPADRDRIANAERENTEGIFHIEMPAGVIFSDFEAQSKATTWEFYREQFHGKIDRKQLRPVSHMIAKQEQEQASQASIERYFQGQWSVTRPLQLSVTYTQPPAQPRQTLEQLKTTRQQMLAKIDAVKPTFETIRNALGEIAIAEKLLHGLRADIKIQSDDPRISKASQSDARQRADVARKQIRQANQSLESYEELASQRFGAALQLLYVPKVAQRIPQAAQWQRDSEKLLVSLRALSDVMDPLLKCSQLQGALGLLVEQLSDNNSDSLISALQDLASQLYTITNQLRLGWSKIRYPYRHTESQITLAKYLMPTQPIKDDLGTIFNACSETVDSAFTLYVRLLGDLIFRAETVESAIGLPQLPEPATEPETAANP